MTSQALSKTLKTTTIQVGMQMDMDIVHMHEDNSAVTACVSVSDAQITHKSQL